MKVLLTGASGFVGSHVLDRLRADRIPAVVLLRPGSSRKFIQPHLAEVEIRLGSISEPGSLAPALEGVTHVIHCAGCTKAVGARPFYEVNQAGTRNLVEAVNSQSSVLRLVHISSLAAGGPALAERPAREEDEPHPVSEYGRSKLAGEVEVQKLETAEHVILRPPAVYGPRDLEFLRLFLAVKRHLAPRPSRQALSLVYAPDLAAAAVACLQVPGAAGRTYYAAAAEIVTARGMAAEISRQMGTWTVPLPLPSMLFWPLCLGQELWTRLTGKPNVLSWQKLAELRAPGWVCDPTRLRQDTGIECATGLVEGIRATLAWYRANEWI